MATEVTCPRCTGRLRAEDDGPACWTCGWRPLRSMAELARLGIREPDPEALGLTRRGTPRLRRSFARHEGMRLT